MRRAFKSVKRRGTFVLMAGKPVYLVPDKKHSLRAKRQVDVITIILTR
jgi:hypothetical protein